MSPETTRRSVLKRSTAGLVLFAGLGTGAVGTAAAKEGQGGSGLVRDETWAAHDDDRFQVVDELGTREFACRGNEKTWRCYEIRFADDDETHLLHVNPERRLDTVEEGYDRWHEFTPHRLDCEACARVKVSFKPVTPRNDR